MLSTISRQTLRAASVRQLQGTSIVRSYASDNSSSNNNNKSEGTEALMNILNSSPQKSEANTSSRTSFKSSSAELIMDTLNKATDRQNANRSAQGNNSFLNSKLFGGLGSSSGSGSRHFLSEPQTASHNLHIHASMNNTILTLTDSAGDPITTQSAGSAGFKKSARSGPEAGYQAMLKLIEKVEEKNVNILSLHVLMKGFGPGRDSAFKAIRAKTNWDIKRISDTTPIPFNGCRPPKARRL
ncbi:hypothetical protein BG000_002276 [Podila horticola]|nr:hypothetical protein BG003_002092 [Podila horticola]KAG0324266.1 hypothetical protein BG000_002276 [Podila horticola]